MTPSSRRSPGRLVIIRYASAAERCAAATAARSARSLSTDRVSAFTGHRLVPLAVGGGGASARQEQGCASGEQREHRVRRGRGERLPVLERLLPRPERPHLGVKRLQEVVGADDEVPPLDHLTAEVRQLLFQLRPQRVPIQLTRQSNGPPRTSGL